MKRRQDKNTTKSLDVLTSSRCFNVKLILVVAAFLVIAGIIATEFYRLQITQHEVLAAKAAKQQFTTQTDQSRRGMILDRNGYPLVASTYVYRVGITPSDVTSRKKDVTEVDIVEQMAHYLKLDDDEKAILLEQIRVDRLTGWSGVERSLTGHRPVTYISVKSNVPEVDAMALRAWLNANSVGGVRFDAEERRVYNNAGLASPVLGMTRMDEGVIVGVSGLEATYDKLLAGQPGYVFGRSNNYATRGMIPFGHPIELPAKQSTHLVSTIDFEIQTILQEELLSIASAAGLARDVHGIVMDVHTGDILAMGQVATYAADDPTARPIGIAEDAWEAMSEEARHAYLSTNAWNNINITDVYEPGSTFKTVTLAIGLEENVVWEGTGFEDNPVTIQGETIHCYFAGGHGRETLREAFYNSCNPIFVDVGARVGKDRYYDWIHKLGFYGRTGIDLPAETRGLLHQNPMPLDFANLTFGESSSVTAIQLAQFYAMIGNGGYAVTPRLACGSTLDGIDVMEPFDVEAHPQIFSENTCRRVRSMLRDVVQYGTATDTFGAIGLNIGGKTGTARDENDNNRRTLSFIGMVPNDAPEYVVLVTIRKPETGMISSRSAVRAASRIAARIEDGKGRQPRYTDRELAYLGRPVVLPDLSDLTVGEAAMELVKLNLAPSVPTDRFYLDRPLAAMMPSANTAVGVGSTIWLCPEREDDVEWVAVPDFTGHHYHQCIWLAAEYGVTVLPVGTPGGTATGQDTPATAQAANAPSGDVTGSPAASAGNEEPPAGMVPRGHVVRVSFGDRTALEPTERDGSGEPTP